MQGHSRTPSRIKITIAALAVAGLVAAPSALAGQGKQPLRCPGKANQPVKSGPVRGLDVKAASEVAAKRGCQLRVVRIDGKDQIVTDDFSRSRVNVAIREGEVRRVVGFF